MFVSAIVPENSCGNKKCDKEWRRRRKKKKKDTFLAFLASL